MATRPRLLVSRVVSAVGLAAMVGGLPVLLYLTWGSPIPATLPSLDDIAEFLSRPDDGTLALAAIKILGWLSWAYLTIATATELISQLTGRHGPHLPGTRPIRRLIARALTTASLVTATTAPTITANTAAVAAVAIPEPPAEPDHRHRQQTTRHDEPATTAVTFIGGMLAGSVLATLGALRHVQRQHRRPGRHITLPADPGPLRTEGLLRWLATRPHPNRIRPALRALGQHPPAVLGMHVLPTGIELLLDEPAGPAPPPFTASQDGHTWTLPTDGQPLPDHQRHDLIPGMLTVGRSHHGGELLLNLGHLGIVTCHGDDDLITDLLRAAAIEAATTRHWDREIILVGFPELHALANPVHLLPTLDDALTYLATGPGLPDYGCQLTLLITAEPPQPSQLDRLQTLAHHHDGLAALTPAPTDTTRSIGTWFELTRPADRGHQPLLRIHPHGLLVRRQLLTSQHYADICALFTTAATLNDAGADTRPYLSPPAVAPAAQPSASLQVRILGPLQITGAAAPLQPKHAEIIVLLALHGPLTTDQLRTYLGAGPDHPKPADELRSNISKARSRLGPAPDGQPRIQTADATGHYRLHDIDLDWWQFQQLVNRGIDHGEHGAAGLRAALALIRGQPLADCYWWWLTEDLLGPIRDHIIDTAELLANLELSTHHDPAAAKRAARAGLAIDPTAEPLWRMLMRAEHAAGNMPGLHAAYCSCRTHLADVTPDGDPHPATEALYRHLTGRSCLRA